MINWLRDQLKVVHHNTYYNDQEYLSIVKIDLVFDNSKIINLLEKRG